MCQEEVRGWNCEEVAVLRCGSWSLLTGYRVGGRGEKGVCGGSEEEAEGDGGEDEAVTVECAAVRSGAHRAPARERPRPLPVQERPARRRNGGDSS